MPKDIKHVYIGTLPFSPLGPLWAGVTDQGVYAVEFGVGEPEFLNRLLRRGAAEVAPFERMTTPILEQVLAYLKGERQEFDVQIDWEGTTPFTRQAREAVMQIPYGETRSYGEIAAQLGKPGSSRAVGRANATNPAPLIIPCHRVLGADGSLTGYGGTGGIKTKQWLLDLERSHADKGQIPMPGMAG